MATTTTAFNGKNVNILCGDHDNVLVDRSGQANEFNFDGTSDVGSFTVYEDDWTYRLVGKKGATLQLTFINATGASEALRWLEDWWFNYHDQAREIVINFPDSNVGSERLQGYYMLAGLPVGASAGEAGPMVSQVTLESNGEVVHSVVGS